MKKHQVLLLLFSILNVATLKAKVEIASIFNDNMVLQQQMDVNIWGTASPNKKVTIQPTWTSTVFSTTSPRKEQVFYLKIQKRGDVKVSNVTCGYALSSAAIELPRIPAFYPKKFRNIPHRVHIK